MQVDSPARFVVDPEQVVVDFRGPVDQYLHFDLA